MACRKLLLAFATLCFSACANASQPADAVRAEDEKKVWTNEDVESLRAISAIMESGLGAAGESSRPDGAPAFYTKFKDPRWYREQLEPLRAELDRTTAELRRLRAILKSGKGGTNTIVLDQDTEGITPESAVVILQQRRVSLFKQIDALEDLAQKNGILPGELRKDRSPEELAFSAYLDAAAQDVPEPETPKTEEQWRKRFAELREQLYYSQKELNILQWEWNTSLVQYYPDPNKAIREEFTLRELNTLARKIREKKAEIAQLKQAISDLEDDLRHAGGPPGWSRE